MKAFDRWLAALAGLVLLAVPAAGEAGDRHAGYYYPPPQSEEVYEARARPLPDTNRSRRIGFVTRMTQEMLANPYPPPFHIYAKGAEAEKMIVTSVHAQMYNTLYRMRALLAALTATARLTPYFRENSVDDYFTFFDLAVLLGFERITVTDGDSFAHRILLR